MGEKKMFAKIQAFISQFKTLTPVFNFFSGRHTFFALFFAITGFILAWTGKLTGQYVCLISALQAYVLIHSTKEDIANNGDVDGKVS
jgi:hypothetical protein